MYLKVRHRKSHRSYLYGNLPPRPPFMSIPVRIEINILIMYSSNLLLTQILTSLRACPAMARSYRGRMPQLCPARLCPYSGSSRFLRPLCPVERRGLSSWAKGAGWRRWLGDIRQGLCGVAGVHSCDQTCWLEQGGATWWGVCSPGGGGHRPGFESYILLHLGQVSHQSD